jgi:hypothetical protein
MRNLLMFWKKLDYLDQLAERVVQLEQIVGPLAPDMGCGEHTQKEVDHAAVHRALNKRLDRIEKK